MRNLRKIKGNLNNPCLNSCLILGLCLISWSLSLKISFQNQVRLYTQQVSRTYHLAISKALRETLEYLENAEEDEAAYEIYNMLLGEESVKSALTTEFIEEKLELYREKREEMFGRVKSSAVEQLTVPTGSVKDEL